jgi:putative zinc finger/helix-turn-helix YgiT family protein
MKCPECGKAELVRGASVVEYHEARLPYSVILQGVPIQRCPDCGEELVSIPDPGGLHEVLCRHIITANRALLPGELRFLRRFLDRSSGAMAALIGVDAKTMSRWENGKQKMGAVAERLLRVIVANHLHWRDRLFADRLFPELRDEVVMQPEALTLTPSCAKIQTRAIMARRADEPSLDERGQFATIEPGGFLGERSNAPCASVVPGRCCRHGHAIAAATFPAAPVLWMGQPPTGGRHRLPAGGEPRPSRTTRRAPSAPDR